MKIGLIQTSPLFGEVEKNIEEAVGQIEPLEADLFILPELFSTGYQFLNKEELGKLAEEVPRGGTAKTMINLAQRKKSFILFGIAEKAEGSFYNSAVLVGEEGLVGLYRKSHLFYKEKELFTPGNTGYSVFDIGKARIGVLICFDWRFPEPASEMTLKGADILCHPSNLVLPNAPDGMIVRSLENGVYSITVDRVGFEDRGGERLAFIGKSQVVSPQGQILYRASDTHKEARVVEIDPLEARDKKINPYNDLVEDRRFDLLEKERKE